MVDISDMVIASLSKIWHLVPIVIAIVLLKKFINNKDKMNRIKKNEENEKNGLSLELRVKKKYEDLSYNVVFNETKDENDEKTIDLICDKNNKILFFKCNNTTVEKSITEDDIKIFYSNALKYIKTNNIKENNVEFVYAISFREVLDKSAIKILSDNIYNCKYVIA